ncbi:MAG: phage GP46 family protein [Betaproteobacteria bacterium]|jgi:phage gp46-like protein|nr:phage GP46 family protein [Rubrivivax sp.]
MDAWINPLTADYAASATAPGDLTRDPAPGIGNAVYLRLQTPLGTWWAEPALGSRLHELQREKATPRTQALARQYALQALQPLLTDGRCSDIDVAVDIGSDASGAGRLLLAVTVTPAGGAPVVFRVPVRVA